MDWFLSTSFEQMTTARLNWENGALLKVWDPWSLLRWRYLEASVGFTNSLVSSFPWGFKVIDTSKKSTVDPTAPVKVIP